MSEKKVPFLGKIKVCALFDGEFWWTLRKADGSLYAWGWETDLKEANSKAREAGLRLGRELGYL